MKHLQASMIEHNSEVGRIFGVSSDQKELFGLSAKLTFAQVAPLIASLFIAGLVAGFGSLTFSAYMLVSTINITTFIAATGLMQGLYYLFGKAQGRNEPITYRATMIAARYWVWILSAICFLVSVSIGPVLQLVGVYPELCKLAGQLGVIAAIGLPPMISLMLFRIHASTNRRAGQVSILYILGALMTCVCVYIIVTYFDVAFAYKVHVVAAVMVVSNWALAGVSWFMIRRPPLVYALQGTIEKIESLRAFREVWVVGWPVAVVIFLESLVTTASTVIVARYWPDAVPAFSVVLLWVTVGLVIPLGVAQATTQKIAIANASELFNIRNQLAFTAVTISLIIGCLAALVMALFPADLGNFLLGTKVHADLFREMMWLGGLMLALQSVIVVSASALRGVGITRAPLLLAAIGYLGIGLGGAVIGGIFLEYGVRGLWYGLVSGFLVTAIAVTVKVYIEFRHIPKIPNSEKIVSAVDQYINPINQPILRRTL